MTRLLFITLLSLVSGLAISSTDEDEVYILSSGDQVRVGVYLEPELSLSTRIDPNGLVNFPLLGQVKLSGRSIAEAKSHLENLLLDGYLVEPKVSIQVTQYRPFFVSGEVVRSGSFVYQPGLTVQQAIVLAGGLRERASNDDWFILRGEDEKPFRAIGGTKVKPGDVIKIEKSFF